MTGLLLAETKKLFSTKLWWALGIPVVVFSGLGALPLVLTPAPVTSTSPLLHGAGDASLFVVAFAAMLFTSEFRYGTIISTVLAAPRRFDIVVSKALIGAVAGLLYGSIATIVTFVTGIIGTDTERQGCPRGSQRVPDRRWRSVGKCPSRSLCSLYWRRCTKPDSGASGAICRIVRLERSGYRSECWAKHVKST